MGQGTTRRFVEQATAPASGARLLHGLRLPAGNRQLRLTLRGYRLKASNPSLPTTRSVGTYPGISPSVSSQMGVRVMRVVVPNLIGLDRGTAEALLDSLMLRYVAKFPFSAGGNGLAAEQSPEAGTTVGRYSVVTVSYPSIIGPLPDSPVLGLVPPVVVPNLIGLDRGT